MKNLSKSMFLLSLVSLLLPFQTKSQDAPIFPLGEKAPNVHHTGDVWLSHLSNADSTFHFNIATATFAPGARLDWHLHPGGQHLLITDGISYYQERNKPLEIFRKGEVVKCQPSVEHWHGATPDEGMSYVAVTGAQPTKWLKKVSDEDYFISKKSNEKDMTTEQELINLSKQKWQWLAEKDVEKLTELFHEKSKFVHMGGSWGKQQELDIIKGGGIWYKQADIHEGSVETMGNTAIVLNKVTLLAVVGGNEVTNPFMVTEVYLNENGEWKLGSLSFTKLLTN